MSDTTEAFAVGDPVKFAMKGVEELSSSARRSNDTLQSPIQERYDADVSGSTARLLEMLNNAKEPMELIEAARIVGLNEVESFGEVFASVEEEFNSESPDLGDALSLLDQKLGQSLCDRESDASKAASRKNRETVYIPELIKRAEEGTVYMAKTLSSTAKLRMAWDLNPDNQVVVVDDYDKWEALLGWEKLKQFPHGKNKIREEYGDRLSDEVLSVVADDAVSDSSEDTTDDTDSTSRGRATRTKPSEEVLNIARGNRQRQRKKIRSKEIAEAFEEYGEVGYNTSVLVLFPTTCDHNMTDHWWVPGRIGKGEYCAIANCNKGTFEYLNQYEQVWHIEDYLGQAGDYEFETSAGPVTMNTAPTDNLVIHTLCQEMRERFTRSDIFKSMPRAIHKYVETEMYSSPPLPHEDDMVYAPLTTRDVFWLRPELRQQVNPEDGDAIIASGSKTPRDMVETTGISSSYKLYARARLPDWDFSNPELDVLDDASSLYMDLDAGAYELLETLGRLHDAGEKPFSDTPEQRWK